MEELKIRRGEKAIYDIVLNDSYKSFQLRLVELGINHLKACIVCDSNTAGLFLKAVRDIFMSVPGIGSVVTFEFPAGESQKTLKNVERLYTVLIENHFERTDYLVALGGGVVGDLTGYAAATYLRGIRFIQLPTTLLSDVDSSIGGKTGVDFMSYKNMVGAFHQPSLVFINTDVLSSLPGRQFASGMAEVIKHSLIADPDYFSFLKDNVSSIKALSSAHIEKTIYKSLLIKGRVVEEDPEEKGLRRLLNFGHTIGHAIEKLSDFVLFHGECVSIGIMGASFISMKRGYISESDLNAIKDLLSSYDLPVKVPGEIGKNLDLETVLRATKSDKKMAKGRINFVLLRSVGEGFVDSTVTDDEMLSAIDFCLN